MLLLLAFACSDPPPPPPPPQLPKDPVVVPSAEEVALAQTEDAAKRLGGGLKARVVEELGRGGPAATIEVCNKTAPELAAQIQTESGVKVGRGSLRLRNPQNAPPPWVQEWLTAQGERPAEGVQGVSAVVDGQARVLKPIVVEAPCLACHGAPESLAPEVKDNLAKLYPQDAATGYAVGDLRGALWAERPVER